MSKFIKNTDWITVILSILSCFIISYKAKAADVSIYTASSLNNTLIEYTTSCNSTHKLLVKTSELDKKII